MKSKPKKQERTPIYDYFECRDYIESKYKIKTRNLKGGSSFWSYIIGNLDGGRPLHIYLNRHDYEIFLTDDDYWRLSELEEHKDEILKVYKMFLDEFADDSGDLEMEADW